MLATDFTRDDCLVGKKRRAYKTLTLEWRCVCGGTLTEQWSDDTGQYPEHWLIQCAVCGGRDFIHEHEYARQECEAAEVLEGLPAELVTAMGYTPPVRTAPEIVIVFNPQPIEL